MIERPPVAGTARALTYGALLSAALLTVAFLLTVAQRPAEARLVSALGIVMLLVTPAVGLVVTFVELRPLQPRAALLAVLVLAILGLATLVALLNV